MEPLKNWIGRWWSWSTQGGTGRKAIGFGLPAVLVAILVVVAQGDEEPPHAEEEVSTGPAPTAVAQVQPSPTPEPSPTREQAASQPGDSRCEAVSQAMLDLIDDQLTVDGGGSLRNGFAVKSGPRMAWSLRGA